MTESENHNPFAAPQIQDIPAVADGTVDFAALRTAGTGLRLIYFSLLLLVLAVLGSVALAFVAGQGGGIATVAIMAMTVIAIGLFLLIGVCLCTTVPSESRAKGLAISSAVMLGLQVAATVVGGFGLGFGTAGLFGSFAMNLFSSISMLLFVLFMRNLSFYIHRGDLARRALRVLILQLLMIFGGGVFLVFLIRSGGGLAIGGGIMAMLAALIIFVMYANLVNDLGTAIRNPNKKPDTKYVG